MNKNYDNDTTIELHNELNPSIWENNKLRQDVKTQVIKIVNEFKDFIDIPINVLDIQLVGSNCNYNYNYTYFLIFYCFKYTASQYA